MYIQHGKNLVEHHTHYKELHGFDKTILMNRSKHTALHNRLRKTGKCKVSVKDLNCISCKASTRTHIDQNKEYNKKNIKYKYLNTFSFEKNAKIQINLRYNIKTKNIGISSIFSNILKYENNFKYKYLAFLTFEKNTKIQVRLKYNIKTCNIGISSAFSCNNR